MADTNPQEVLAWEARRRPPAGIAALLGALAVVGASVMSGVVFADAPRSWFGASVTRAVADGALAAQQTLQVPFYEFYDERSGLVLLGSVVRAFGWLATGWVLYVLAGAAVSRRPELPKATVYIPLFGGAISALATLMVDVSSKLAVDDFLAGPRTVQAAQDVTASGGLVIGQFLGLAGALGAALAFVLISLNAMRAGLLTRFMGVLGIIVGALLIFPVGSPVPIVQIFWLVGLGVVLLDRWPGGTPPAWRTGEAEPWPSAAEQRARARGETPQPQPEPVREPAGASAAGAHAAAGARKKKRKNRG